MLTDWVWCTVSKIDGDIVTVISPFSISISSRLVQAIVQIVVVQIS